VLAVKGPPTITGVVSLHSKIVIPPGPSDIAEKLRLEGQFTVAQAFFKQMNIQRRIDKLSDRGRGDTVDNGGTVASNFRGQFTLNRGVMQFGNLTFGIPGVAIALNGTYGLLSGKLDMHGTASLEAKLSQTVTGFKSVLLKAVDPLFSRKGKGAVIPIAIGGTREAPAFRLDAQKTLKEAVGDSPAR
jgi:hypothetical protein